MVLALGVDLAPELLTRALTHRSYAYENGGLPTNERLEFLGDAVLGLVVTEALYLAHPDLPEGQLAKLRSSVVNMAALAGVGRRLGLGPHLLLGRGEEITGGRDKDSLLADTVEALIGAVHLEHGLEEARSLVRGLTEPLMTEAAGRGAGLDWKTSVQELAAARGLGAVEYAIAETGPDHAKTFTATLVLSGTAYGTGVGRSKKIAEQRAAATAHEALAHPTAGGPPVSEPPAPDPPAPDPPAPDPPAPDPAAPDPPGAGPPGAADGRQDSLGA